MFFVLFYGISSNNGIVLPAEKKNTGEAIARRDVHLLPDDTGGDPTSHAGNEDQARTLLHMVKEFPGRPIVD